MQQIEPFYDKEIKCDVCECYYTTKKLRTRFIRTEKVHTDFYTEYKDELHNPYLYEVYVCPTCGYSATENFSEHFLPNAQEEIYKQISSGWKTRDFGGMRSVDKAIQSYKLAILSGTLKGEKNIVIAGLCVRLAWLYRMKEEGKQEQRFLRLSLKYYRKAYETTDYIGTQMSDMRLLYLIGELYRRTGNNEEAIRYFSRVIGHKNKAFETKLVEMARDQWYEIRDKDENAKSTNESE